MPQMSPMYWLLIALFVYLNFMLVVVLINTVGFKFTMFEFNYSVNSWMWLW